MPPDIRVSELAIAEKTKLNWESEEDNHTATITKL